MSPSTEGKRMKKQSGFTLVEVLVAIIGLAAIFGWINNIIIIANTEPFIFTGTMVLRLVGIVVAPLGCVMGFL